MWVLLYLMRAAIWIREVVEHAYDEAQDRQRFIKIAAWRLRQSQIDFDRDKACHSLKSH